MHTSWGSATDRGPVRRVNEDALLAHPPVFLVADGMGGHAAGAVASGVAVEEFRALTGKASVTPDEVHAVFGRIVAALRRRVPAGQSAGTTVAGVAVATLEGDAYWLVFNIGDSRVYRVGPDGMEQVSVDHSVVQELMDTGLLTPEGAADHPDRFVITRAVGTDAAPEPDYWLIPALPGDRILVCSDGLTNELADPVIERVLGALDDPQEAAQDLVDRAVAAGGHDNVTVVVVDVGSAVPADLDTTAHPPVRTTPGGAPAPWVDDLDGATLPRHDRTPEVPS